MFTTSLWTSPPVSLLAKFVLFCYIQYEFIGHILPELYISGCVCSLILHLMTVWVGMKLVRSHSFLRGFWEHFSRAVFGEGGFLTYFPFQVMPSFCWSVCCFVFCLDTHRTLVVQPPSLLQLSGRCESPMDLIKMQIRSGVGPEILF